MKKLLIVDTIGIPSLKQRTVEGTKTTIVHTLTEAWQSMKSSYDFDSESWYRQHPGAPTPVQAPHFKRAQEHRQAQLACRLPYWDAILFYLQSNSGNDLCSAIGCATVASLSGCRYIRILEFSETHFSWFPKEHVGHGFRIQCEDREFRVSKSWNVPATDWVRDLRSLILNTHGYDGILFKGTHPMPQPKNVTPITAQEFFEKEWPGLPWKI